MVAAAQLKQWELVTREVALKSSKFTCDRVNSWYEDVEMSAVPIIVSFPGHMRVGGLGMRLSLERLHHCTQSLALHWSVLVAFPIASLCQGPLTASR